MNYFVKKVKKSFVLESIKWICVMSLLMTLIAMDYLYYSYNVYLKTMLTLIIVIMIIFILMTTKLYKLMILFGKESYLELQQVLWPTGQESLNTTLIVIVVTIVLSLILWGLDTILVGLISFGLRL